jgi:protein-disulfide isomerase
MFRRVLTLATLGVCLAAGTAIGQASPEAPAANATPDQAQLIKSAEAFVRDLYAWGPEFTVKLGPLSPTPTTDYYKVPIAVTYNGQTDRGVVYVSKDGKSLLRGDLFDMQSPPYAGVRAHLNATGNPSTGPADAPVTLVEFADFECPHCKEFSDVFPDIKQKFPNIRLVYKDLPLNDIHPWAESGAVAARCAFMQSAEAFWKMHDQIFKEQDNITPGNAWDEFNGFAKDEGLDTDAFKTCLSSPEAKAAVDANRTDAVTLGVDSTPTVYVNGRPAVGGDPNQVVQFIQYELDHPKKK